MQYSEQASLFFFPLTRHQQTFGRVRAYPMPHRLTLESVYVYCFPLLKNCIYYLSIEPLYFLKDYQSTALFFKKYVDPIIDKVSKH